MLDDNGVINGDVDSEDSPLEDPSVAIITLTGRTSFQSLYNSEFVDMIGFKLGEQESREERNVSEHQESKLGGVKCVFSSRFIKIRHNED